MKYSDCRRAFDDSYGYPGDAESRKGRRRGVRCPDCGELHGREKALDDHFLQDSVGDVGELLDRGDRRRHRHRCPGDGEQSGPLRPGGALQARVLMGRTRTVLLTTISVEQERGGEEVKT